MTKYTVKFKIEDGKTIYPKIITIDYMEFKILKWTEDKFKAISWNEYDCADDFAMEFENTEVVEIKEENIE